MDAVDTNILVYAAVAAVPQHKKARDTLRALAEGPGAWALPWPCCYEFLRIVTHPRVYKPPMSVSAALGFLRPLLASPSLRVLHESERHFAVLERLLAQNGVSGNLIHDAHIAALCEEHGVGRLITADRDSRVSPASSRGTRSDHRRPLRNSLANRRAWSAAPATPETS